MLDVVFCEDQKRKGKGNSARNMSTVYKTILPILKRDALKASIQKKGRSLRPNLQKSNIILLNAFALTSAVFNMALVLLSGFSSSTCPLVFALCLLKSHSEKHKMN